MYGDRYDAPQHLKVIETAWIGRRIVGHEEPEKDQDQVLKTERQPIYVTPSSVLRDHAGENTGDQHTKEEARDHN